MTSIWQNEMMMKEYIKLMKIYLSAKFSEIIGK